MVKDGPTPGKPKNTAIEIFKLVNQPGMTSERFERELKALLINDGRSADSKSLLGIYEDLQSSSDASLNSNGLSGNARFVIAKAEHELRIKEEPPLIADRGGRPGDNRGWENGRSGTVPHGATQRQPPQEAPKAPVAPGGGGTLPGGFPRGGGGGRSGGR